MIGSKLGSVHVKDRLLGGGTVPLGTGNADLMTTFNCLFENEFNRWFILQAARDKNCSELDLAVRNKEFVESLYSGSKQTIV
jgi:hexulose-6-phosphate isomerase